jgi:hypothetical protein
MPIFLGAVLYCGVSHTGKREKIGRGTGPDRSGKSSGEEAEGHGSRNIREVMELPSWEGRRSCGIGGCHVQKDIRSSTVAYNLEVLGRGISRDHVTIG